MHPIRKRFGQHFLCDQSVIDQIVAAINPKPSEHLVEIGPGLGALTLPVLAKTKRMQAIEIDRDAIAALKSIKETGTGADLDAKTKAVSDALMKVGEAMSKAGATAGEAPKADEVEVQPEEIKPEEGEQKSN